MKIEITPVPAPISQTMLYVCEKCGKKLTKSDDPDDNPSRKLQKAMKKLAVERFGKKVVRPMVSSCMDLCPEGLITIGVMDVSTAAKPPRFFTISPGETDDMATAVFDTCLK